MGKEDKKIIIGVLGAVGSDKSSVAREFEKLGCKVINADRIAHETLTEKDIKGEIVSAFGDGVLNEAGQVKRSKLAELVFESDDNVEKINRIVHPRVLDRCEGLIRAYGELDEVKAVVLDVPLLAEVGWAERCDVLVFVQCSEESRYARAVAKGPESEENVKKREKFQFSLDKKLNMAHYTVDNNSDLSEVVGQVERIFSIILNN